MTTRAPQARYGTTSSRQAMPGRISRARSKAGPSSHVGDRVASCPARHSGPMGLQAHVAVRSRADPDATGTCRPRSQPGDSTACLGEGLPADTQETSVPVTVRPLEYEYRG